MKITILYTKYFAIIAMLPMWAKLRDIWKQELANTLKTSKLRSLSNFQLFLNICWRVTIRSIGKMLES